MKKYFFITLGLFIVIGGVAFYFYITKGHKIVSLEECLAAKYQVVQVSSTVAGCKTPEGKVFTWTITNPNDYKNLYLEYGGPILEISGGRILIKGNWGNPGKEYSQKDITIILNSSTIFYDANNVIVNVSYFHKGMLISARGWSQGDSLTADWVKEFKPSNE